MPRNAAFQRGKPKRPIGQKLIIAVEGKKTEYGYFEAIRQDLRLPSLQVVVVKPPGTDPLDIVRTAIDEMTVRRADRNWLPEDSAWAVFDGDEHIAKDREKWNQALTLAKGRKINVAVSNPCFELWYLLHYQDQTGHITLQAAFHALKRHVSNYDKALALYPDPLKALTNNAVVRAQFLEERGEEIDASPHQNPCTGVWKLVGALLALEANKAR
jgi:hypothetical protein